MMARRQTKWMHFGEYFQAATERGFDEGEAGEALRGAIANGVAAYGYRRCFIPQSERREVLPRDTQPQRVPLDLWRDAGPVRPDMTSSWLDDPEQPDEWIEVDWISGLLKSYVWNLTSMEIAWREYHTIHIPERDANALLQSLAGAPVKRQGRPKGPSSQWEREQVEKGIQLLADGSLKTVPQLAAELTDPSLQADAHELQKRRISAGLRTELARAGKPRMK